MSFQFPERKIPPSTSPSGNTYPAVLVDRETADIPTALDAVSTEREARRITRGVLDAFWSDIEEACSAPFLQLLDRGGYNASAERNRNRIAHDHEAEEEMLRGLQK